MKLFYLMPCAFLSLGPNSSAELLPRMVQNLKASMGQIGHGLVSIPSGLIQGVGSVPYMPVDLAKEVVLGVSKIPLGIGRAGISLAALPGTAAIGTVLQTQNLGNWLLGGNRTDDPYAAFKGAIRGVKQGVYAPIEGFYQVKNAPHTAWNNMKENLLQGHNKVGSGLYDVKVGLAKAGLYSAGALASLALDPLIRKVLHPFNTTRAAARLAWNSLLAPAAAADTLFRVINTGIGNTRHINPAPLHTTSANMRAATRQLSEGFDDK